MVVQSNKYLGNHTMYIKKINVNKYLNPTVLILTFVVISTLSSLAFAQAIPDESSSMLSINNSLKITGSSCDNYTKTVKKINQSGMPINLNKFTQTPNGINISSDYLNLQVENFQSCQASEPFSDDQEVIAKYQEYEQRLNAVADKDINELSQFFFIFDDLNEIELAEIKSMGKEEENYFKNSLYMPEPRVIPYLDMATAYYLGEYVPKNDTKALQYLKKVVDYYQSEKPEWSNTLLFILSDHIASSTSDISDNNPIRVQENSEVATYYLLSQAGHLDTNALLIMEDINQVKSTLDETKIQEIHQLVDPKIDKLIFLANQGSYNATGVLAELYEDLEAIDSTYAEKAKYWQDKYNALPQPEINWN